MIHDNLILILGVIIGVIILEIYLKYLILSVKKQFQWIITKQCSQEIVQSTNCNNKIIEG